MTTKDETAKEEAKRQRKQQMKDAELRQELAAAEEAEVSLAQAKIELQTANENYDIVHAQPDHTGMFSLTAPIDDDNSHLSMLRYRLISFSKRNPGHPIELALNSLGGSIHDGMLIYNTLRQLSANGHHVTTIVSGWAASMAATLFQAGDTRIMGSQALLMLHEPLMAMVGNASSIREESEFLESLAMQFANIFALRSTLDADEIRQRFRKKDWWVYPQEALSLGFADEVTPL